MRGRKPKPTALKALQGNRGKRKVNREEPPVAPGIPGCPNHLNAEAKTEWYRVASELHQAGLLTRVDRAALAAYCVTWSRWVAAEHKINKQGPLMKTKSGNVVQNPYVGIANRALEMMAKFMTEFGLTPSSRSRIRVEAGAQVPEKDEFSEIFGSDQIMEENAGGEQPAIAGKIG